MEIYTQLIQYLLISVAFNLALFIPAFLLKTDKLTDLSYSLSFIFLSVYAVINRGEVSVWDLLLVIMVVIWALRLGTYLFIRINKTKVDHRFDGIRESFWKFGGFWLLQGITVWVVLIPALLFFASPETMIYSKNVSVILMLIGTLVWIEGLLIETVADFQKYKYIEKAKKQNLPRHWVDVGLWKHSRHPNYFGEVSLWVGVYIFTLSRLDLTSSLIGTVGPIFIFLIVRYFSGARILEKKNNERYRDNPEYQKYKQETGLIWPKL
jgi:steroid 5-alpha reductase family enzyme